MAFALTLLLVAGADVVLLKSLAAQAKETQVLTHEHLFSGQLSLMLYLLPAAFAGLGINLVSHVLINHLNEAEAEFDVEESAPQSRARHWLTGGYAAEAPTDKRILIGCGTAELIIFVLDLLTGSEIRLHVLYIFPLAVVAQYRLFLPNPQKCKITASRQGHRAARSLIFCSIQPKWTPLWPKILHFWGVGKFSVFLNQDISLGLT